MTLYEIAGAYRDALEAVEAGDIPEEAIADTLDGIEGAFEVKADNIALLIKEREQLAAACAEEARRLAARAKAMQRRADSLRGYLARSMIETGLRRIETARNKIGFRVSERFSITDVIALTMYARAHGGVKIKEELDKTALKAALKAGADVPGAAIEEHLNLQIK